MCVFFFKRMTAYELRISDWSSAVCSSDLQCPPALPDPYGRSGPERGARTECRQPGAAVPGPEQARVDGHHRAGSGPDHRLWHVQDHRRDDALGAVAVRSAARRVGKAGVSTCRARWALYTYKKKKKK